MLAAEFAVLVQLDTVRIVLFVLSCVVVSLLALAANQCYFYSHNWHLPVNLKIFYLPQVRHYCAQSLQKMGITIKTSSEVSKLYHISYLFVKSFLAKFVNIRRTYSAFQMYKSRESTSSSEIAVINTSMALPSFLSFGSL